MTVVVDASCVVAALTASTSEEGARDWAREMLASGQLVAPHLVPVEVPTCCDDRRRVGSTVRPRLTRWAMSLARRGPRRTLATLDARLAAAPGPRCDFACPAA